MKGRYSDFVSVNFRPHIVVAYYDKSSACYREVLEEYIMKDYYRV